MKRIITFLLTSVMLFACAFGLCGCKSNKRDYRIDFNAKLVFYGVKKDFLNENLVKDVYGLDQEIAKDLPKDRTIVIDNKEKADEIYASCDETDFAKEMLVLHIYPSYNDKIRTLKDVHIENGDLIIGVEFSRKGSGEQPKYTLNYLTVKLDKVEYNTINVSRI